tara:strand:- start:161 stop:337 length:177 start_codon:yes stop_codon:yes gene_type:complete
MSDKLAAGDAALETAQKDREREKETAEKLVSELSGAWSCKELPTPLANPTCIIINCVR